MSAFTNLIFLLLATVDGRMNYDSRLLKEDTYNRKSRNIRNRFYNDISQHKRFNFDDSRQYNDNYNTNKYPRKRNEKFYLNTNSFGPFITSRDTDEIEQRIVDEINYDELRGRLEDTLDINNIINFGGDNVKRYSQRLVDLGMCLLLLSKSEKLIF